VTFVAEIATKNIVVRNFPRNCGFAANVKINAHRVVRFSWSLDSFKGWLIVVKCPCTPDARRIAPLRAFRYAGSEWWPLLLYQTTKRGSSLECDRDQPPYLQIIVCRKIRVKSLRLILLLYDHGKSTVSLYILDASKQSSLEWVDRAMFEEDLRRL